MTNNQRRAVALATDIWEGRTDGVNLTDSDWHLLLLAAGLNRCQSIPLVVADRVLQDAGRHAGYFAHGPRPDEQPEHPAALGP